MSPERNGTQLGLIRWSEYQAGIMLVALGMVLLRLPLLVILIAPVFGFGLLLAWNRTTWTPQGAFGAANATTLLRLLFILGLPAIPGTTVQVAFAVSALALDGADGWLARRFSTCSEFGAFFDQEVDAVFTLILGMLLFQEGLLGPWILIPGGLRYGFVLFAKFARPPVSQATGSFLGKVVCVGVLAALILCLLPLPRIRTPLALAATIALCGSFALSIRAMYKPV